MTDKILKETVVSISELKKDPVRVVESGNGMSIAVIEGGEPVFYCIPAHAYKALMEQIDDAELLKIINERMSGDTIKVNIDDL